MYKHQFIPEYNLTSKLDGIAKLENFYKKINTSELEYYINVKPNKISSYINSSIIEPKDVELTRMINSYITICKKKFNLIQNNLLTFPSNICVSFTEKKVYWDNIFTIDNIIFINYDYLKEIFVKTDNSDYKSVSEVYIIDNEVYDLELLKQIFMSIIYISMCNNIDLWLEQIKNNLGIIPIHKNNLNIKLDTRYIIYTNPNTHYLDNFYFGTMIQNKENILFNLIHKSQCKFNPYIENVRFNLDELKESPDTTKPLYSTISADPISTIVQKICQITFL